MRRVLAAGLLALFAAAPVQALDFTYPGAAAARMMALIFEEMLRNATRQNWWERGAPGSLGSMPTSPLGSMPGSPLGSMPGSPLGSMPGNPLGSMPGNPLGSMPGNPLGDDSGWDFSMGRKAWEDGPWSEAPGKGGFWGGDWQPTATLDGQWVNRSGEVFQVQGNRFALRAPSGQTVSGTFELDGNRLRTYMPGQGPAQEYTFARRGNTLVLLDEWEQVLVFRRR